MQTAAEYEVTAWETYKVDLTGSVVYTITFWAYSVQEAMESARKDARFRNRQGFYDGQANFISCGGMVSVI